MLAKDAVFLAPHKFAGGPSTPGMACCVIAAALNAMESQLVSYQSLLACVPITMHLALI